MESENNKKIHPLFPFMAVGSFVYAFFYALCLYQNKNGITFPFFVGGTCFFFFYFLKKSGRTAKKFSIFLTISLMLLGFSTCMTDAWTLLFLNKLGIFLLFFYLMLHCFYEDKKWDLGTYFFNICDVILGSLAYLMKPFTELSAYCKERQGSKEKMPGNGKYVLYGLLISVPMLFVILLLLGSADAVFGNLLENLFTFDMNKKWGKHAFQITGLFLFAFFSAFCLMYRLSERNFEEEISDKRTKQPVIAITFTSVLSFVYAVFCLIQVVFLFGGIGTLPEGYTYASYAREGFFQLVFVCMINLSLVLICKKYFKNHAVLNGLLTFVCGCTYIMIFSSAYRMILYIKVYQLTFLRVFVLWALLVIFLLVTGALIKVYRNDFPLVKSYAVTVTVLYLLFSFAHPDYWIAKYNLDHTYIKVYNESADKITYDLAETQDLHYISKLSKDAAPVIFAKMTDIRNHTDPDKWYPSKEYIETYWWFTDYQYNIINDYVNLDKNPLKFNFSKYRAIQINKDY
ncbi:MAG: DUF4173 domain-containing protein [Lachnospiraceae bacterium]|nr:DUF4173 domain-containing protein [Lachnospiraceae bacterium]